MYSHKRDKGRVDPDRKGEGNVTTEAKAGAMQPQAKESWQSLQVGRGIGPLEPPESRALSTFGLQSNDLGLLPSKAVRE